MEKNKQQKLYSHEASWYVNEKLRLPSFRYTSGSIPNVIRALAGMLNRVETINQL